MGGLKMGTKKELIKKEFEAPLKELIDPELVLNEAQKASQSLDRILKSKPKKVLINNEQYLEFEDWQTLGEFYGRFVKTDEIELVTINGTLGFKAKAHLFNRQGIEIGGAEAYCMKDEKNWQNKPLFQLASMAQTRAGAKALRNNLAWVAVLAGYRPTPAEEIVDITPENVEATSKEIPQSKPAPKGKPQIALTVSQALQKRAGTNFNVIGKVTDTRERKNKNNRDITDYFLKSLEGSDQIIISKWGKTHEGIREGDTLIFKDISIYEYQGNLTYLAKEIEKV